MANQKVKKAVNVNTSFWKLALSFMISFGFILIAVFITAELFKSGNLKAIPQSFKDGTWLSFIGIRLTIIIGYGFVMAFLTKRKAKNII